MSTIPNYKNVFNEPATTQNLSHIFDILNEKNADRIVYRDFSTHIEDIGVKLDAKAMRKVYDHIASSVKKQRYITKETWMAGINTADKHSDTKMVYKAILSGKQYDPQSGRQEIEMDEIRIKIQDTKAPWQYRIQCMESLCRQITSSKITVNKFHELFRSYHVSLTKQAKDRRSNVMRVACESFAKIILKWKHEFLKYSYTTIEYLFELIRTKIQIVHESGLNAVICLLKNCGDHKQFKMMDILGREGTTSKFVNLQKDCFDLLLLYLSQQSNTLKQRNGFWSKLLEYTEKGVNDTADVRNSALKLLAKIENEKPNLCQNIISKMNIHLKKRYDEEYRNKDISYDDNDQFDDDDDDEKKEEKVVKKKKKEKKVKQKKDDNDPFGDDDQFGDDDGDEKKENKVIKNKKKKKVKQKKEDKTTYKINKRPKDDQSDHDDDNDNDDDDDDDNNNEMDEDDLFLQQINNTLQAMKEDEKDKKKDFERKEKEKQQRLKEKKAKKEEMERENKLKQERKRKEEEMRRKEIEKNKKLQKENAKKEQKRRLELERKKKEEKKVNKEMQKINKIKNVNVRKKKLDEMRSLEKEEREKREKEELDKKKKEQKKREKIIKHNKKIIEEEEKAANDGNDGDDDDYGYPNIHIVFHEYLEEKGVKCSNASNLVLYAKDNGYGDEYGITFQKVSKYLKADYKANKSK